MREADRTIGEDDALAALAAEFAAWGAVADPPAVGPTTARRETRRRAPRELLRRGTVADDRQQPPGAEG